MKRREKIKVGPADALVVFRPDGTYETSLPEIAGDDVPEHLITSAAVVYALQSPEMMDLLFENFHRQCRDLKEPKTLSLFPGLKS